MVIHGRDDCVFSIVVGLHLYQSLKNSEFHVIQDTSHQVFEEDPGKVAELILKFILNNQKNDVI